jgi:hypothetical protein
MYVERGGRLTEGRGVGRKPGESLLKVFLAGDAEEWISKIP